MSKKDLLNTAYEKMEEVSEGVIDKTKLTPDTVILDSGLDSLGYAQVMLALEDYTDKSLMEDDINWGDIRTIDQLVSLFL
ncbi:phosphopantetheine-binding protein [bacterium]|nr:phosphopantetheine-binding protein [bacterium]